MSRFTSAATSLATCGARPVALQGSEAVAGEFGGEARVKVESVSCLGRCDGAPAVLIELHRPGSPSRSESCSDRPSATYAARLRTIVAAHLEGRDVPPDAVDRSPRPWRIDPYRRAADGVTRAPSRLYQAARDVCRKAEGRRRATATGSPFATSLIAELEQANLRGMGGAGTPAAQKWRDVLEARGDEKYIVCNADESEPATFKDRELLLRTPDLVIEGMVLAALLVRARHGYIYIRHEYHDQIDAVNEALAVARDRGVIGPDVARHRLVVRHRGLRQPGRLRLRRAGGLDRGDRRAQGRAAQPPAPARDQRALRQAHAALQRRDVRLGARDRA